MYDAVGSLIKTVDNKDNTIELRYDIFGNKTYQDDPDMGKWTYTYNSLGELTSQTDSKSQTTTISYDKLGRKIKEDNSGVTSTWDYDTTYKGKLHKESKPNFSRIYSYDKYGRVTSTKTTIDAKTFIKSFTYDKYGRVDVKTLPDNFKIKNVYNQYGYLEAIKSPKSQIKDFDPEHFVNLVERTLGDAIEYYRSSLEYQSKAKELQDKVVEYKALANKYADKKEQFLKIAKRLADNAKRYTYYYKKYKGYSDNYKRRADIYLKLSKRFNHRWTRGVSSYYQRLADRYAWYSARYAYYSKVYLNAAINHNRVSKIYAAASSRQEGAQKHYITLANKALKESKEATAIAKQLAVKSEASYAANEIYQKVLDDSNYNYFYKVLERDSYSRVTKYLSGNGLITNKTYDKSGVLNTITTGYNFDANIRELNFEYDKLANVTSREDKKLGVYQAFFYDRHNRITSALTDTKQSSSSMSYSYDSIGNMTRKSDIGSYTYSQANPHQVIRAGNKKFTYDLNGNMINNNGTKIEYNSFNKPSKIITSGDTVEFTYDTNKQRYKKDTNKYTSYYLGKTYEQTIHTDGTKEDKYFIYAGNKVISIYTNKRQLGVLDPSTKYLHYDSLNSVDTITNNLGVVEARMAYKPFGEKLNLDKDGKTTQKAPHTNRGYTGHEHIEETNLIHMNARLYDPTIARFLSADTIIQDMYDTQAFNRYTYVRNNPLKYTDPSGHSWVSDGWKKHWKTIVTIAAVAVVAIVAPYLIPALSGGFWGAVGVGAIAGFTGGVVGTRLNGGSWNQAWKNGLKGAAVGAISAGAAFGVAEGTAALFDIGKGAAHSASFFNSGGNYMAATFKALAHGASRAAIAQAQGQSARAGFWSGFAASGFSVGTKGYGGFAGRTLIMATVSGTVSEATGGKFANGAMTGAFVHMFNDEMDPRLNRAMGTDAERAKAQRVVSDGFDKVANVAGAVSLAGVVTGNTPLAVGAEIISAGATTMKYVISPDSHSSSEIINDYLPPVVQSTNAY